MKTIELCIPVTPRAQKRDRIAVIGGHARSYKDSAQSQYEAKVRAVVSQHRPERPYETAIALDVMVMLPIPASWSRKKQQAAADLMIPATKKPDIDNCAKQVMDILTGVFWQDDRQVTTLSITKFYSRTPGWNVKIRVADGGPE